MTVVRDFSLPPATGCPPAVTWPVCSGPCHGEEPGLLGALFVQGGRQLWERDREREREQRCKRFASPSAPVRGGEGARTPHSCLCCPGPGPLFERRWLWSPEAAQRRPTGTFPKPQPSPGLGLTPLPEAGAEGRAEVQTRGEPRRLAEKQAARNPLSGQTRRSHRNVADVTPLPPCHREGESPPQEERAESVV